MASHRGPAMSRRSLDHPHQRGWPCSWGSRSSSGSRGSPGPASRSSTTASAVIENLVVSFPGSQVAVGSLAGGESAQVWLSGREKGTLSLSFTQAGNPMSGFQIPDFDPDEMRRDGLQTGRPRPAERGDEVHGRRGVVDAHGPPGRQDVGLDRLRAGSSPVSGRTIGPLGIASMPKTTRTFVAIPIPAPLGEKLVRLQGLLAPQVPAARWTTTLPFHMTLAFLGDVADTDLNAVCKAVAQACESVARVRAAASRAWGLSPARQDRESSGPGCGLPSPRCLQGCRRAWSRRSRRSATGPTTSDSRPTPPWDGSSPIGADPPPGDLTAILAPLQNWSGGSFTVSEVVTYRLDPRPRTGPSTPRSPGPT